jgi:predicted RNA-binding protein
MAYYINLFSPETYETFTKSNQDVSGFRSRQENAASRIEVGDKFICYMVKLSRWIGILEVMSTYYKDDTPIYYDSNDPYVIRFKVKPIVWLPKGKSVPIHEKRVWNNLSFTKNVDPKSSSWTGIIRSSLNVLDDEDGKFLEELILSQKENGIRYEVDENEYAKYLKHKVRRTDGEIKVSIPQDLDTEDEKIRHPEVRESTKIQALIAKIGSQMGLRIWIPRNDRAAVLSEWNADQSDILENLPLNYDETTIKTIEQIDVLWLRGRAIVRAFEVEHTTSIYSGILRMADLLALQPNMNIK